MAPSPATNAPNDATTGTPKASTNPGPEGHAQPQASPEAPGEPGKVRKTLRLIPAVLRRETARRSRTTPFLIWISFLISFVGARTWVVLFRSAGRGDTSDVTFEIGRNVIVGGYHIHHIATGILFVLIAGWLGLHYRGRQLARVAAVLYGIGLGFIVDEIGFVIGGITPYRDDSQVFYIAVILAALLMSAVYAPRFWASAREDLGALLRGMARMPALNQPRQLREPAAIEAQLEQVLPLDRGHTRFGPQDTDPIEVPSTEGAGVAAAGAAPSSADPTGSGPPNGSPPTSTAATQTHAGTTPLTVAPPGPDKLAAHPGPPAPIDTHTDVPPDSHHEATPYRTVQSSRSDVFENLISKIIEVLVIIIFIGLVLGLAKLVISLFTVVLGVSVERLMQPILVGILTLLMGVQLMRAMVEYLRHSRLMLPFLVDAAILLGLREIATELFDPAPDPVLTGVLGGVLVALGGLRVILVRSMATMRSHEPGTGGHEEHGHGR